MGRRRRNVRVHLPGRRPVVFLHIQEPLPDGHGSFKKPHRRRRAVTVRGLFPGPARYFREMQKKRLGDSDMDLSPIGVGAWAIGGGGWKFGWGPQDDSQ